MKNPYLCVIPAKAGTLWVHALRDSRFRGSDDDYEFVDTPSREGMQGVQDARRLLRCARNLRLRYTAKSRNRRSLMPCALLVLVVMELIVNSPGHAEPVCGFECGPFLGVGRFASSEIMECSGLVVSRKNPGILWVHNDSGDRARLFAVEEDGSLRGVYHLASAKAADWEDLARGPCADPAKECLYVGDIGDNERRRSKIQVYRIEEPLVPVQGPPVEIILKGVERFDCKYPDGPHDAETLLVNPATGVPYLITKESEGTTSVYRFPGKPTAGRIVTLVKAATLPARSSLTGGDVTQDGSMIVLRDYVSAYGYPRLEKGPLSEAFNSSPCRVPLGLEEQGEALGIAPSGIAIYTASEGLQGPIHKARCTPSGERKGSSGEP